MIRATVILILYTLLPIAIIEIFKRKKWMQKCGTVIAAYFVGLTMALTGVSHFEPNSLDGLAFRKWQSIIMNVSVLLAIPLMLFKCDFKLWIKALPKTIIALLSGITAVIIAALSGYALLNPLGIPAFEKITAMLTGMYTGGTMNFNALGTLLDIDKTHMAIVLAFDMLVAVPLLVLMLGGGYRLARRFLPYKDETAPAIRRKRREVESPVKEVEDYSDMLSGDSLPGIFKALGLSLLFIFIGCLSSYLLWKAGIITSNSDYPEKPVMNELVIILVITTLSIIASFSERIRNLPKTFELAMFFILVFSLILASMFDWHQLRANMWAIGLMVVWVVIISILLHYLFCRIFRISGDLYMISLTALLCSPPFVPPVVGAMGNKKVLIPGIAIGLFGYAIGTYIGVGVAFLLGAL